jgi:hypothetical protein
MPVQKFAPMTKEFPSFDCDAHVTEPPWLWERAKDCLTKDEDEKPDSPKPMACIAASPFSISAIPSSARS